jgi:hypothetical protein
MNRRTHIHQPPLAPPRSIDAATSLLVIILDWRQRAGRRLGQRILNW